MKNKPHRHKEQNTFRFVPFSQRIANIKIDVFRRVKHKYEEDDDEETTYFHQTLEKWTTLNLSNPFEELCDELGEDFKILPQLIKKKNHVVSVLEKHLQKRDHLNVQCILELIVALANDLRQDFHPHFLQIYHQMIPLVESRNPELMEWTFHALAYLFKFLWRCLVSNLTDVFNSLLPLLSSSKPQYINGFAAQSFAFVARKVKEPAKLVKLTVRSLKKFPDGVDGCGRLLFEIVKGVPGQFHSCAEYVLDAFLDSLVDPSIPHSLLCGVLTSSLGFQLAEINAQHIPLVWTLLLQKLQKFHTSWKEQPDSPIFKNGVDQILRMLLQATEFKTGLMVTDPSGLVNPLFKLLQPSEGTDSWTSTIIDIFAGILLSPSLKLTQELCSKIVKTSMTLLVEDDLMAFVSKTKSYSGFEGLILPPFLSFCSTKPPLKMLDILSALVLEKAPMTQTLEELLAWTPYSLDFSSTGSKADDYGNSYLNVLEHVDLCTNYDLDELANALVILPNLSPLNKERARQTVTKVAKELCAVLTDSKDPKCQKTENLLVVLPLAVEALIKLKPPGGISAAVAPEVILKPLLEHSNAEHLAILRILDFYVCCDEEKLLKSSAAEIQNHMFLLIGSPYAKVRSLALHIFLETTKSVSESDSIMVDLLENAIEAEDTSVTIADYRERIKTFQKLSCVNPSVSEAVIKGAVDGKIFLRHLLGNLYINFKLLWEPLSTIVVSYSQTMPIAQFWEVLHGYLNEVIGTINSPDETPETPNLKGEHLTEVMEFLNDLDERPDHINCRILLLKILEECAPICETKNKDVVTLFLNFLNEEYFKKNAEAANTWDITRKTDIEESAVDADSKLNDSTKMDSSVVLLDDSTDKFDESKEQSAMDVDINGTVSVPDKSKGHSAMDVDVDGVVDTSDVAVGQTSVTEAQDEDEQIKKELREVEPDFDKKFRWVTKSLLAHLAVFAKLRSPKSMHKERELYKLYIDFLSHKFPDVQRAALDCIMTYKFKYLIPYKENLYGLIDDKTFKTEVSLFRIDTESDVVKAQHRPDLIPLVLRIVYSKMYTKSSATKGFANKQARKATVIRFLAGCNKLELESFFHMAFSLFHEWVLRKDILGVLDEITLSVDLKAVIPPRRLQSAVYLLNTVLVYCGGLLGPPQLGYLLRVVLCMMAHLTGILQNRDDVFPGYLRAIRSIRNTCFEVLARFYKTFDSYSWTTEETEAVFKVFVWPYLSKLPIEGIYSPTAQLRLFMVWSQNPRYFVLLGKAHDEDPKLSPVEVIMNLWLCEKAHGSVCNAILEMVQSLMTMQDFTGTANDQLIGEGEIVRPLDVLHQAIFDEEKLKEIQGTEALNYGSKLLVPFVPVILERLRRKLVNKKGLDRREREVMSRVTELVTDAESSEVLLELLLPVLIKKAESSDDVITPLLTTVYNLIKNVSHPGRYVRRLAPLYGSVVSTSARKVLFSIVIALSKLEGSESGLDEQLLDDLNAWDTQMVDQPDFTRRLSAFNKLESMADEGKIEVNLGIVVIYTCFHFVRNEKDMSLRDNSRHCLEKVCVSLCRKVGDDPVEKSYVLDNIILGQIRRGFKSKQPDNVRNDSISLLGYMARECGDLHPVLNDLSHLADKQDMEVDFFENLRHLQLHRRVRAMLKFSTIVTSLEKPPGSRTLTQFILPIISHYLVSEKYQSKNTIVDSAIKALGTTCQYLPWHQYQTVLTYYISQLQTKLDFQKQIVRILVDILNAFHFDLSKADLTGLMEVRGVLAGRKWKVADKESEKENKRPAESKVEEPKSEAPKEAPSTTPGIDDSLVDEDEAEGDQTKLEKELDQADENEAVVEAKGSIEIVLSPGSATKVITVITQQILPKLHQIMAQKTSSESHHKLTRKMTGPEQDEEEILKVPLAVASVKLLQKLPSKQFLDVNLPGIFMKLCTFLKSRLESVRRVTRDTLQTIMVGLGPDYLPTLVREMRALLTRGYQVHVLVYSVHSVLVPLEPLFQRGHLDKCANSIIDICRMDLFGRASEEKEVNQIAGKVLEARSTRSFDTFKILAKYVTERYLVDLLLPLKEELSRTMSHKYVNKVRLTLEQVVLGLTENNFLLPEHLLPLAYGTSSESIPSLIVDIKEKPVNMKRAEYESRRQPDSFLLAEEPKRAKVVEGVNTCARTNSHLLVEFGLRLLLFLLKREKVKGKEYTSHLDPFVGLIKDCLNSQHVKICTIATKCLNWMVKINLPSMEENIADICGTLFSILHKFAVAGLSKGDNFDLVMVTFNAVACVVRDMKSHKLTPEQMRTLILYCEQDIEDTSRQATAFSLLKALLARRFRSEELTEVIQKVAYVSIKALEDSVRLQARQIVHSFIMNYPLGKKIQNFLAIYYGEFNYEYLTGRTSALEMIKSLTNSFPIKHLKNHAPVIFINVSTVLVNDSEPSCQKTAAETISLLLSRLEKNDRDTLFDLTCNWLNLKKEIVHRKLAAQLIGLFVACEKTAFEARLKDLLPAIVGGFVTGGDAPENAGRFVKAPAVVEEQESTSLKDRDSDHFLFQLLQSIVKIATHCPALLGDPEYAADIETIADHATNLLGHPHQWVRHSSVQLIGLIVTSYKPEDVAAIANDPTLEKTGFLLSDTRTRIKSLTHDIIAQLIPSEDMNEKYLLQCMKLLTYLTVIVKDIQPSDESKLSVPWMVRMVQKMINFEVVTSPSSIIVRTMAFNWSAAISLKLSKEELSAVAVQLLKPIARQLNVEEDDDLKKSAREASHYIRKKIGQDLYKDAMAKLSQLMDVKRAERKKQRSQLMVTDPERAAKRKISKNLKKKESQKKKIKMMKMQTYKRKKRKDPFGLDD